MAQALKLPTIDLSSTDQISTANSIRQACLDHGFFYLINHGVEESLLQNVLEESRKFFCLPLEEKMKVARRNHRGYTPLYAENLDPSSCTKGDSKESFYIGPLEDRTLCDDFNQWPSNGETFSSYMTHTSIIGHPETLPHWRSTMEEVYGKILDAGKGLVSIIALALDLEEDFFHKLGALDHPNAFLRLLHYPGDLGSCDEEIYGASAHSDYGMITLLTSDGVGGLQVCRDKSKEPRLWEDVHPMKGALIVNIGDMTERWTNGLFRSTLHRVMPTGRERYSMAFFLDPNPDCIVECLKSCCSETSPPRFQPIRAGDYLIERLNITYAYQKEGGIH